MLLEAIARLERLATAVQTEMEADKMEISLSPEERFEVFGDFDPETHRDEVEQRWGGSEAFEASQRRVSGYSKDDWMKIKAEGTAIDEDLVRAKRAGVASDAAEAMDLAERHRRHISRWFYNCSLAMQVGLGQMYVTDPRFRSRYDDLEPGLAEFLRDAIEANARRAGREG